MAVTRNILRVHLVNGDVRAVKYEDEDDCTRIIHSLLSRLGANLSVSLQLFGLEMTNACTRENYWLAPGVPVADFIRKYLRLPLDDWKFVLKLKILPKTPQHLCSKDTFAYLYLYEQVLHNYLQDPDLKVDNDTAIKLGCLELRRFYRDLPQIALSRSENFKILEKEIGLQKFFRKSLLHSVKPKVLRKSVLHYFKEYEGLPDEGCVDRFFSLVSKYMSYDVEVFPKCSIEEVGPLSSVIRIGPNCDVEVQKETGECKLIALFQDIVEVKYQPGIAARGQLQILSSIVDDPLIVRTGQLAQAMNMANIIEGYCQCITGDRRSRMRGFSVVEKRTSPLPPLPSEGELRPPMPLPPEASSRTSGVYHPSVAACSTISSTYSMVGSDYDDYAEISEKELMATESQWYIPYDSIVIEQKIGEGQFGDVHVGKVTSAQEGTVSVAIKSCKMATTQEEKMKFMREAIVMKEFTHPHIIRLHGWTLHDKDYYILMELAPYGELRNFLISNSGMMSTLILISYISQLGSAMSYLESMNYVHRDIAARNLLLVTPGTVKLGDFGLSRWLDEGAYYIASRGKLPIKWMAPESIYYRRFTTASDVWMFGVCAWEILMKGVKPFMNVKNQDVVGRIENGDRLPLPPGCPSSLFHLMMKCWSHDPLDRPTFSEIDQKLKTILSTEKRGASPSELERLKNGSPLPELNIATTLSLQRGAVGFGNGVMSDSDDDVEVFHRSKSPMEYHQDQNQRLSLSPHTASSTFGESWSSQQSPSDSDTVKDHLANRPLPPPPPDIQITQEPMYSPIRKRVNRSYGSSSDHRSDEFPDEEESPNRIKSSEESPYFVVRDDSDPYSYVTVKDQGGVPEEFNFNRPLPTPPPEDEEVDEEEGSPVEDAPMTQEEAPLDQDTYEKTMNTVRTVVLLSQGVPVKEVSEYASMVMNVGKALRELVQRVEEVRETLPESEHQEILMAVKMVNSDMMRIFKSMKECQQFQHTNVVNDFKRQMLQEAHCLGQNVKSLFETVNTAMAVAKTM